LLSKGQQSRLRRCDGAMIEEKDIYLDFAGTFNA